MGRYRFNKEDVGIVRFEDIPDAPDLSAYLKKGEEEDPLIGALQQDEIDRILNYYYNG